MRPYMTSSISQVVPPNEELLLDPNFENVDARDRAGQTAYYY